jgi:hypothetical protein
LSFIFFLPFSSYPSISFCFRWFHFAFVGFVLFRFHFVDFVSFRFVFVDFVLLSLVSFYFVFISLISFRFVSFSLISFRFVSFLFRLHFIGTRIFHDKPRHRQFQRQITLQCILIGKTSWSLSRRFPWIGWKGNATGEWNKWKRTAMKRIYTPFKDTFTTL